MFTVILLDVSFIVHYYLSIQKNNSSALWIITLSQLIPIVVENFTKLLFRHTIKLFCCYYSEA